MANWRDYALKQKLFIQEALKHKLIQNFISLGSLQVFNLLVPLVLTPYLIKTLGVENFGRLSLVQAVITYFSSFTDYGFNLTATREIAIHKENKNHIQAFFGEIFTTKIFLTTVGLALLYLGLLVSSASTETIALYLLSYTLVIGQAFMPLWLFQGMEDMKYITLLSIITKLTSFALIFLLIRDKTDYIYVNLLTGAGTILSTIISYIVIRSKFNIKLQLSSWYGVKKQLKEGWHIFISNIVVNVYMNTNIIILGLFASKEIVGFYSVAEKIVNLLRQILQVYYQVTYPHVCNLLEKSKRVIFYFYIKVHSFLILGLLLLCSTIFLLKDKIIYFFTASFNTEIEFILTILLATPIIVGLNIPANQLLVAFNFKKPYSITLIIGAILNIILNFILSSIYLAKGTAITVITTEILITIFLYIALNSKLHFIKPLSLFNKGHNRTA